MPDPFAQFRKELADTYAIEREIGRGGMATVYLAQDLKHDRQVAVKVLLPELSTSLGTQRFLREVKIAAGWTENEVMHVITGSRDLDWEPRDLEERNEKVARFMAKLDRGDVDEAAAALFDSVDDVIAGGSDG